MFRRLPAWPKPENYISWALSRSSIFPCFHPRAINLVLFQILGLCAAAPTHGQPSQSVSFLNQGFGPTIFPAGEESKLNGLWKKRPERDFTLGAPGSGGSLANSIDGEVDAAGNGTELLVR